LPCQNTLNNNWLFTHRKVFHKCPINVLALCWNVRLDGLKYREILFHGIKCLVQSFQNVRILNELPQWS
ncbi:hypothetical protein KIL84_013304, partial [Mauremys mutica]